MQTQHTNYLLKKITLFLLFLTAFQNAKGQTTVNLDEHEEFIINGWKSATTEWQVRFYIDMNNSSSVDTLVTYYKRPIGDSSGEFTSNTILDTDNPSGLENFKKLTSSNDIYRKNGSVVTGYEFTNPTPTENVARVRLGVKDDITYPGVTFTTNNLALIFNTNINNLEAPTGPNEITLPANATVETLLSHESIENGDTVYELNNVNIDILAQGPGFEETVGGSPLLSTQLLENGKTYYIGQQVNWVDSWRRKKIVVQLEEPTLSTPNTVQKDIIALYSQDKELFVSGEGIQSVKLYTSTGTLAFEQTKGFNKTNSINIAAVTSGVYIAVVATEQQTVHKKVIVQ